MAQSLTRGARPVFAARNAGNVWSACYEDRSRRIRVARDARGKAIQCETEELALSVAQYRHRRIFPGWGPT
jgi:hypothetical protein